MSASYEEEDRTIAADAATAPSDPAQQPDSHWLEADDARPPLRFVAGETGMAGDRLAVPLAVRA